MDHARGGAAFDMPIGSAKEFPSSIVAIEEYNMMYKALKCITRKYKFKKRLLPGIRKMTMKVKMKMLMRWRPRMC